MTDIPWVHPDDIEFGPWTFEGDVASCISQVLPSGHDYGVRLRCSQVAGATSTWGIVTVVGNIERHILDRPVPLGGCGKAVAITEYKQRYGQAAALQHIKALT